MVCARATVPLLDPGEDHCDDVLAFGVELVGDAIRARDLLKRAVVLTSPAGTTDVAATTEDESKWSKLMAPGELERLQKEVTAEAAGVASLLKAGQEALARQSPQIDAPPIGKIGLDQHAFVGDNVEEFSQASAALSGQRTEAGRRAARQTVYVFAPEGAVLPVFVATRKVLRNVYGIELGAEAYRATRLDPEAIIDAERKLDTAGYFGEKKPPPIPEARVVSHRRQALEAFLRTSWSRLEALAVEFGQYQPHDDHPISPKRIADYLRQFESERIARPALLLLEGVQFKDRRFFATALEGRLASARDVRIVCPFGSTGDSSAFLSYLMSDLPSETQRPVLPLELALDPDANVPTDSPLMLWDDFCGRAGHAATTLSQWLGLPALPGDPPLLEERLARRLSPARDGAFKARDVKIAFALARPSGLTGLGEYVKRHKLERVVVLDAQEERAEKNRPFETDEIVPSGEDRAALRVFLEERMRVALGPNLARPHRPWTEAMREERLLGYGSESHLLVFPDNVPTVTLTALWARGPGWSPLFCRREKPSV